MVILTNSPGGIKYGRNYLSHNVSTRLCYELDKEYFKTAIKKYRLNNLELVKMRQKRWYDNKPEVIEKRKKKALEKKGNPEASNRYFGSTRINNRIRINRQNRERSTTDYNKRQMILELKRKFNIIEEEPKSKKKEPIIIKPYKKERKTTTISFS